LHPLKPNRSARHADSYKVSTETPRNISIPAFPEHSIPNPSGIAQAFSLSVLPLGFSHKSELVMCKKKAAHDDYWKHVSGSSAYHWNLVHQIGQAERNFKIKGQRLRFQFKYLNFAKFRCSYNFFFIYFS